MRLKYSRNVASGRVTDDNRSLVNDMDLQLEYVKVLNETMLVPFLIYGRKTKLWKQKEKSKLGL